MIQTPNEKANENKIRDELEQLTIEINKIQKKIDETAASTWLLKDLCRAKDALEAQRNQKINLLNSIPRW